MEKITPPSDTSASEPRRTRKEVDWTAAAPAMAATLPASNPAAEALLSHLDVPDGALVVDIACGVGQPSLLLAGRRPTLSVLGIDLTQTMLDQATTLAAANGLSNATFQAGSLDSLPLIDGTADAVISQFGFLQEGTIDLSVAEAVRILKPGGALSVVVFDDMGLNTLMSTIYAAFAGIVDADLLPDFPYLTALASPGERENRLRTAGMTSITSELVRWEIPLPSFEALWSIALAPAPFGRATATLHDDQIATAKLALEILSVPFRKLDGQGYAFPVACRTFWGKK